MGVFSRPQQWELLHRIDLAGEGQILHFARVMYYHFRPLRYRNISSDPTQDCTKQARVYKVTSFFLLC